jgi:hypothetical protein
MGRIKKKDNLNGGGESMRVWTADKSYKGRKCAVCKQNFKVKDEFILCPIQAPKEEGKYISAIAIPIHTACYYVEEEA